jgi:3-deoxy-D-manno-octulosonic-acid transferase
MNALALRIYSLLMWLVQPLMRRKLTRRGRQEPGYLAAMDERFGHYTQAAERVSELVWVHAVSLGEARTAALLLKALRAQHPDLRILLTHGTATGRAEGVGLLQPGDVQVWQPWDSPAAVARFFNHFKPRLGLLMETEIWPNMVAAAQARAMPLVLVNGRLSEKSLQQALRMAPLSRPAYGALSAVYAQTETDAQRFRQLGATVAGVFGNLKFDATPDARQLAQGQAWRQVVAQPVLMFASSREGEEDEFFKEISAVAKAGRAQVAITTVAKSQSEAVPAGRFKALIVPRHPQRFGDVQALAEQQGLRVSRRSTWAAGPAESREAMQADIWLGDSLGEMALYYALSDVALLGGSFAPLGGQNLIEAAACGCPVVMGPHTYNFAEAAELAEAAGAARRVAGLPQAVQAALLLLGDPQAQASAVSASLAFAARNRGATARTLNALRPFLQGVAVKSQVAAGLA